MTTAARRAEKREAQRENYAAQYAERERLARIDDERILDAIMTEDWEGNFTHDQQRALARMFRRIVG